MSWNRTKYDQCAYRKEISQSTSPIYYMMDGNKFYNNSDCRPDLGIIAGNNVSVTKTNMVDMESDLFGINRPNSLCPERKYIPHCNKCDEISGIPCSPAGCPKSGQVKHLPECQIVSYPERINHVGYHINYPSNVQTFTNPPQFNPTQTALYSEINK